MKLMNLEYGLILIDYNSGERTYQYLKDFVNVADVEPSIIVIVDNYMDNDESFNIIKKFVNCTATVDIESEANIKCCYRGSFNNVQTLLIKASDNLGYAKANNLAAKILNNCEIYCALFSNSDIRFDCEKLNVSLLLTKLHEDENILGIGSEVVNLKNERQSPCNYLSIEDRYWREKLFWPLLKNVYKRKDEIISDFNREQKVYRLIGAFFVVNLKNFFAVEGFDEHTFLYAEELILAERAINNGYYMYYIPGVKVIHEDGYTQGDNTSNDKPLINYKRIMRELESNLYYYRKYRNASKIECFVTKLVAITYTKKRKAVYKILNK